MKKFSIFGWILVGLVLGSLLGGFFPDVAVKFKIIGQIFMNLLKMMVVPLIVFSLIVGVASLGDIKNLKRIGTRTIFLYFITTAIAVVIGILCVNILKPGVKTSINNFTNQISVSNIQTNQNIKNTFHNVILGDKETGKQGLIPNNIFRAINNMDMMPIILFCLLFGVSLSLLGEKAKVAIEVISTFNDAVIMIIHWIVKLTPFGVGALIAARIGDAGGFVGFLPDLKVVGKYFFTVLLALFIHSVFVLPLILKYIGKYKVLKYFKGVRVALVSAFSTASSSATLPITMECVEENNNISNKTASFVLPLGATINMDGTALYEAVAAIFIAQVYGISLSFPHQIIIFLTSTLAAIGAAGIPQAGLVTMIIVLKAVNLPIEGIALILAVDWLLDRFRTTVNVWGDTVVTGVVERFLQND